MVVIKAMLAGAIMLNAWAIALYFWRFWRKTRDSLFAFFAAGFFLLGVERVALVFEGDIGGAYVYLIRLCAFSMIVFAILRKNLRKQAG